MASVATETGHLGVKQGVETILRRYGFWASFQQSFPATNRVIRDTVMSIYRLVSGGLSPNMIGGPAGIATVLFYKAQEGFSQFVHLLFIISVNLALINLLPIPILDGGHLVLLTAEKFKGRPVKEKTMAALQYVGLAFLIALVLFATKNDIVNFF
jgi:regulator of sigma E protease